MAKGIDRAVANLNAALVKIKDASMAGVMKGGLIVQGEAQRHVPVEYGNLRASAYTQKHPSKKNTVQVGFTAEYAFWVQENVEEKWKGKERKSGIGQYWGPRGESKFLEKALMRKRKEILAAVAGSARNGGKGK